MTDPLHSAVSLFSGCGGFCEGIELGGFSIRTSVEWDRFAASTYRLNFPGVRLFEGDVSNFLRRGNESEAWRKELTDVDLVFGGPPCQGFSQIGTRDLDDDRNSLYREFIRVVSTLRPKMFLMENVPNLVLMQKGHFRDLILKAFRRAGYSNATITTVVASDYGVPQLRKRVVFVGTRDEDEFSYDLGSFMQSALAELRVKRPVTVREAIGDLPECVVDSGETMRYPAAKDVSPFERMMRLDSTMKPYGMRRKRRVLPDGIRLYNHHTKEILSRRLELIRHLEPGLKADSLPRKYWDGLRPEKWRRLHPDQPSHTVLAQMHRDLSEFVHPWLDRWITVREAARLQSFHDGFVFAGSEWQQLKQIGNAVPPLLGYALSHAATCVLEAGNDSRPPIRRRQVLPVQTAFRLPDKRPGELVVR